VPWQVAASWRPFSNVQLELAKRVGREHHWPQAVLYPAGQPLSLAALPTYLERGSGAITRWLHQAPPDADLFAGW